MSDVRPAIPIEVLRKVTFKKVPKKYAERPVFADSNRIINKIKPKLKYPKEELTEDQKKQWGYIMEEYNAARKEALKKDKFYTFKNYVENNFRRYLRRLTVQDMMRIFCSTCISMGTPFNDLMEKFRPAWVFRKIGLSSWHWGRLSSASYNECAEAYNCLVKFDIGIKDFSVEVDTSNSRNDMGYSRYTRTFLDTELAYIIKYKGEHVLTVGFNTILGSSTSSDIPKKAIQIRQIQCKSKKGNRWMYKLPKNYVDFVVDKFFEVFIGYDIYLIRASSAVDLVSKTYLKTVERYIGYIERESNLGSRSYSYYQRSLDEALSLLFKFDSIDAPRMKSIYGKKLPGYKRKSTDKSGQCSLLKIA